MEDDDLRDLQERCALISEMAVHPGWTLLMDRARHSLFVSQQRVILGRAKDFEDYKAQCAWMDGVSFVLDLPKQVQAELDLELLRREDVKQKEIEDDEDPDDRDV